MWSANTVTPFNRPIRRMKYTMLMNLGAEAIVADLQQLRAEGRLKSVKQPERRDLCTKIKQKSAYQLERKRGSD